jgi:Cu(I)/Ag(I) efflux system membrane protein CusA/SilA
VALTIIPPAAHVLFMKPRLRRRHARYGLVVLLIALGIGMGLLRQWWWPAGLLVAIGSYIAAKPYLPDVVNRAIPWFMNAVVVMAVAVILTQDWLPIGPEEGLVRNLILVLGAIGGLLLLFQLFQTAYPHVLRWSLNHKAAFLTLPVLIVLMGGMVWRGFDGLFGWLPEPVRRSQAGTYLANAFPGLGKEFMPTLDEGSFLYMPVTMPHASIGEVHDVLRKQDMAFEQLPEIESAVGKLGRVDSPLDPAPLSMIETVIQYHPQYLQDRDGHRLSFRFDKDATDYFRNADGSPVPASDGEPYVVQGKFIRDEQGELIPDSAGRPFRLWRPPLDPALNPGRQPWAGINSTDDIWEAIVEAGDVPGTTSAPKLQPIAARIVMLQSGMRAPMGVKVQGPDLKTIEEVGFQIESFLKEVPSIKPAAVVADRIIGKPYLEIDIDRRAIARYGIKLKQVQNVIEVAIGGRPITHTVEGRERYPVRVRYMRELRDTIDAIKQVLVPAPDGSQIPMAQLANVEYFRGPQVIKSEDTFLVGYVLFDKREGHAEVDVVEEAQAYLKAKIASGEFDLPAGVSYTFAGSYENQVRAQKRLAVVLPLSLFIIFMILYLQFRSVVTSVLVFMGIVVAWSGGFIMLWFYGQPWFLDMSVFGTSLREVFQVEPINLSVAVWVGFLALFGIASDDGVVMATYLRESFAGQRPADVPAMREATVAAGRRRVRPCLMTTATTILALLPVLTSTGRGAEIMVPMAIPAFGGMMIEVITMVVVPVLYCLTREIRFKAG